MAKQDSPRHSHIPQAARDHACAARKELHKSIETLFPPEFVEHRRAARREMLLAAREMINYAIERLEGQEA